MAPPPVLSDEPRLISPRVGLISPPGEGAIPFVKNAKELQKIPYTIQGDEDMYTKEAIKARAENREDSTVIAALQAFWDATVYDLNGDLVNALSESDSEEEFDTTSFTMTREHYIELYSRISRHLAIVPKGHKFDDADARRQAEEAWEQDTSGNVLEFERDLFFDSLFELADHYSRGIKPQEYTTFLRDTLLRVISAEGATSGYWRRKPGYWRDGKVVRKLIEEPDTPSKPKSPPPDRPVAPGQQPPPQKAPLVRAHPKPGEPPAAAAPAAAEPPPKLGKPKARPPSEPGKPPPKALPALEPIRDRMVAEVVAEESAEVAREVIETKVTRDRVIEEVVAEESAEVAREALAKPKALPPLEPIRDRMVTEVVAEESAVVAREALDLTGVVETLTNEVVDYECAKVAAECLNRPSPPPPPPKASAPAPAVAVPRAQASMARLGSPKPTTKPAEKPLAAAVRPQAPSVVHLASPTPDSPVPRAPSPPLLPSPRPTRPSFLPKPAPGIPPPPPLSTKTPLPTETLINEVVHHECAKVAAECLNRPPPPPPPPPPPARERFPSPPPFVPPMREPLKFYEPPVRGVLYTPPPPPEIQIRPSKLCYALGDTADEDVVSHALLRARLQAYDKARQQNDIRKVLISPASPASRLWTADVTATGRRRVSSADEAPAATMAPAAMVEAPAAARASCLRRAQLHSGYKSNLELDLGRHEITSRRGEQPAKELLHAAEMGRLRAGTAGSACTLTTGARETLALRTALYQGGLREDAPSLSPEAPTLAQAISAGFSPTLAPSTLVLPEGGLRVPVEFDLRRRQHVLSGSSTIASEGASAVLWNTSTCTLSTPFLSVDMRSLSALRPATSAGTLSTALSTALTTRAPQPTDLQMSPILDPFSLDPNLADRRAPATAPGLTLGRPPGRLAAVNSVHEFFSGCLPPTTVAAHGSGPIKPMSAVHLQHGQAALMEHTMTVSLTMAPRRPGMVPRLRTSAVSMPAMPTRRELLPAKMGMLSVRMQHPAHVEHRMQHPQHVEHPLVAHEPLTLLPHEIDAKLAKAPSPTPLKPLEGRTLPVFGPSSALGRPVCLQALSKLVGTEVLVKRGGGWSGRDVRPPPSIRAMSGTPS